MSAERDYLAEAMNGFQIADTETVPGRRDRGPAMSAVVEHPALVLALRTRTRFLGTFNVAVALRGRSTGWGRRGKRGTPRRWFVGHNRGNKNGGFHFGEIVLSRGAMSETVWQVRLWGKRPCDVEVGDPS